MGRVQQAGIPRPTARATIVLKMCCDANYVGEESLLKYYNYHGRLPQNISDVYAAAYLILRERHKYSFNKIARCFGKNHSTIIYHVNGRDGRGLKIPEQIANYVMRRLDRNEHAASSILLPIG